MKKDYRNTPQGTYDQNQRKRGFAMVKLWVPINKCDHIKGVARELRDVHVSVHKTSV